MTNPGSGRPTYVVGAASPATGEGMRISALIHQIETHGVRLGWTRACMCPCARLNEQTRQPDPLCPSCAGLGMFYFGPQGYTAPEDVGELSAVQTAALGVGAVIRGVIQRVTRAQELYDVLGNWVRGSMMVSVRGENRLGYYDRLVNLDSMIVFSEVVTVGAAQALPLRYTPIEVNNIQDVSGTRYEQGVDFTTTDGAVVWNTGAGPVEGTRVGVHYLTHPVWVVMNHPHVLREIQTRPFGVTRETPTGNTTVLPIQASVRLEFLPRLSVPAEVDP